MSSAVLSHVRLRIIAVIGRVPLGFPSASARVPPGLPVRVLLGLPALVPLGFHSGSARGPLGLLARAARSGCPLVSVQIARRGLARALLI